MKTKHLLPFVPALAACLALPALADGGVIPGDPDKPSYLAHPYSELSNHGAKFTGALLQASADYEILVKQIAHWEKLGKSDDELAPWRERRETARSAILARLETHPEEINDANHDHDWFLTPLYYAVSANDTELVRRLLEKGAIPFLNEFKDWQGKGEGDWLLRQEGTRPEIIRMLRDARSNYNVLEIMIQAQKHGTDLKQRCPKRPKAQQP